MRTLFYGGNDGQACRVDYGVRLKSYEHADGADIVVVHTPRLGPATSLINSDEARDSVLNRILSSELVGVRLDLIRFFVMFDADTMGKTIGFEYSIVLDFDDYKRKGHRVLMNYSTPNSPLARLFWAFGIRRRQASVWNKDVVAGCARCYTPPGPARHLDLEEIKALCKSVGHRAVGQLPTWLIEQVESATDLDAR